MADFFKRYSNPFEPQDTTYREVLEDLIKEYSYHAASSIDDMLNNLEFDTADVSFLYQYFDFYGINIAPIWQTDKFNINSLKIYTYLLRNRGTLKTLLLAINSGGSLFEYNKYPISLFTKHNVPPWLESNPKDGIIYVFCQSTEVISRNNFIESLRPMGYTFLIYFLENSSGAFPYYGDVRMGQGFDGISTSIQQTESNQFKFYKNIEDGTSSIYMPTDVPFFGNFGSRDWNNIDIINTIDDNGFIADGGYSEIPDQAGYPAPFIDVPDKALQSASAATLFSLYGDGVQFKKNATGVFTESVGQFSNRRVPFDTTFLEFFANDNFQPRSPLVKYLTPLESPWINTLNEKTDATYTPVQNKWYRTSDNSAPDGGTRNFLRAYSTINSDGTSICTLEVPYSFFHDGIFSFQVRVVKNEGALSTVLSVFVPNSSLPDKRLTLINIPSDSPYLNQWLKVQGVLPAPENFAKDKLYILQFSWRPRNTDPGTESICDVDFTETAFKEAIIQDLWMGASPSEALDQTPLLWVQNWSMETMFKNNLTFGDLYLQYKETNNNIIRYQYTTPYPSWSPATSSMSKKWTISKNEEGRTLLSYEIKNAPSLFQANILIPINVRLNTEYVNLYYTKSTLSTTTNPLAIQYKTNNNSVISDYNTNNLYDTIYMTQIQQPFPITGDVCCIATVEQGGSASVSLDITELLPYMRRDYSIQTEPNDQFWPPYIGIQDKLLNLMNLNNVQSPSQLNISQEEDPVIEVITPFTDPPSSTQYFDLVKAKQEDGRDIVTIDWDYKSTGSPYYASFKIPCQIPGGSTINWLYKKNEIQFAPIFRFSTQNSSAIQITANFQPNLPVAPISDSWSPYTWTAPSDCTDLLFNCYYSKPAKVEIDITDIKRFIQSQGSLVYSDACPVLLEEDRALVHFKKPLDSPNNRFLGSIYIPFVTGKDFPSLLLNYKFTATPGITITGGGIGTTEIVSNNFVVLDNSLIVETTNNFMELTKFPFDNTVYQDIHIWFGMEGAPTEEGEFILDITDLVIKSS